MATNTFKRKFSTSIGTTATAVGGYQVLLDVQDHSDWFGSGKRISLSELL